MEVSKQFVIYIQFEVLKANFHSCDRESRSSWPAQSIASFPGIYVIWYLTQNTECILHYYCATGRNAVHCVLHGFRYVYTCS